MWHHIIAYYDMNCKRKKERAYKSLVLKERRRHLYNAKDQHGWEKTLKNKTM